jgi:hypothetical protein
MIAAGFGRSESVQSRDLARATTNSLTPSRRSIRKLLLPLLKMASVSDVFVADSIGFWRVGGELFFLPRFIFQRTLIAKPRIEVGIFAALDGNDFGAIRGITELLWALNTHPAIGREFRLWIYPLCDPVGYVKLSPTAESQSSLSGEIRKEPDAPEAQLIANELSERQFDGVIWLRGDPLSAKVEAGLSEHSFDFVTPALLAAEQALRSNQRAPVPAFSVRELSPEESLHGWRGKGREQFEITLEVPTSLPLGFQGQIFLVSLHAVLAAYRRLSSKTGSEMLNK